MSKKDDLNDMRSQMKKLQQDREQKYRDNQSDGQDKATLERVGTTIAPVVQAFIETDKGLELQSNNPRGFYIAYANIKLFRFWISAKSADSIQVDAISDSGERQIYSGNFNAKELKSAAKNALLDWYRNL